MRVFIVSFGRVWFRSSSKVRELQHTQLQHIIKMIGVVSILLK